MTVFSMLVFAACSSSTTSPTGGDDDGRPDAGNDHGSGSGSGSGDDGEAVQQFLEQLVGKVCAKAFECRPQYPATAPPFEDEWGVDQNDCVTGDDDYIQRAQIAAAVAAGKIDFDAASAAACLAAPGLPASCSEFFASYDYAGACYDALSGNVADGQACATYWECSGDVSDCIGNKCTPSP